MKVRDHRLTNDDGVAYEYVASPNFYDMDFRPRYLVWHFTAGVNSLGWLTRSGSMASAHLLISRCGLITQLVPFNRPAWHAGGASRYEGLGNINVHSIGIEMENLGRLTRDRDEWWGMTWQTDKAAWVKVPQEQVLVTSHRLGGPVTGWHRYTPEQTEAARSAGTAIVGAYGLREIGHEDILAGKWDPGPAWQFPVVEV